jgi:hypothetical protein
MMLTETTRSRIPGKKQSRTGVRRALVTLALAGSLGTVALAAPMAASASTVTLGPGGISMNADLMQYPASGGVYTSGALAGCKVLVGDHWRADAQASGEGEVSCSTAHNYSMQVLLEYYTPSGMRVASSASSSWHGAAGTWWYLPTGGVCQPGGTATYAWTTYVEISVDGSAYQGWFNSRQNALYTLPAC